MIRALIVVPCTVLTASAAMISCEQPKPSTQDAPTMTHRAATPAALNFTMNRIDGTPVRLADEYAGQVVLIVNVASKCGLTPQYAPLQKLHEQYGPRGLAVLGFPANEFGNQEPGTNEEIATFCETNFGVSFDMFSKIVVKGENISPLYAFLTSPETNPEFAGEIAWNFEKFLISRDGRVISRFGPRIAPDSPEVVNAIERALGEG
ncbi:MAG TPA: glutathione peroxidase [Phycisphaerales bacterium]|nr:glutathione peroxidase [Phycisphaerales bacterium]HRQ75860.1 glutathione peroxidase [Phycisphaerales bacterium]